MILVLQHVTFKLRVFHLWQTNFAFYKESTSSPVQLFIYKYNKKVLLYPVNLNLNLAV